MKAYITNHLESDIKSPTTAKYVSINNSIVGGCNNQVTFRFQGSFHSFTLEHNCYRR